MVYSRFFSVGETLFLMLHLLGLLALRVQYWRALPQESLLRLILFLLVEHEWRTAP